MAFIKNKSIQIPPAETVRPAEETVEARMVKKFNYNTVFLQRQLKEGEESEQTCRRQEDEEGDEEEEEERAVSGVLFGMENELQK